MWAHPKRILTQILYCIRTKKQKEQSTPINSSRQVGHRYPGMKRIFFAFPSHSRDLGFKSTVQIRSQHTSSLRKSAVRNASHPAHVQTRTILVA